MDAKRGPDELVETSSWRLYIWRELEFSLFLLTITSACMADDFDAIDRLVPTGSEAIHEYESHYLRHQSNELTTLYRSSAGLKAQAIALAA